MAIRYWKFVLTARPWVLRDTSGKVGSKAKPKQYAVVARSKFDAELAFKSKHPRMKVLAIEKSKPSTDSTAKNG